MKALELSRGYGGGAYGATRDLTRGQMAAFLIRLWTDTLGNQCPQGSDSPFVDISGTTHEKDINCLYDLGITKGTSATTYGPTDPLKASQISRFLLRTYKHAGNTCPTTGGDSELDEAVNCLQALRVIPTTSEGRSTDPVNRAQMAVYVIGLWHNLDGHGLPPTPPTKPTTPQPPSATPQFTMISAGWKHSCGIRTDGAAVCWGYNYWGQADAPIGGFTTITTSSDHSCGIRTDGAAVCWGDNTYGQTDAPTGKFTTITTGSDHSCGIRTDATAVCWGDNTYGQTDAPTGKFTTITTGSDHSCGIRTDATAVCWGNNNGPGTFDEESLEWVASYAGQADAPTGKFTTITTGTYFSCGIRTDATAVCWGDNTYGQTDAPTGKFTTITTGSDHSCGIRTDRTAVCWGNNNGPGDLRRGITRMGRQLRGPGGRAHRQVHHHHHRHLLLVRYPNRRHRGLLGRQHLRADRRAHRQVHHHHHRIGPLVRYPNRPHRGLLG